MKIGKTIKALRRAREMTQEVLAEQLNISVSAVSQWEMEKTMPDISMLPLLATLFEVTTDELLGLTGEEAERRVHEYLKRADEAYHAWRHEEMLAIMEEAYAAFPTNLEIISYYAFALDQTHDGSDTERIRKGIALCETILDRSRDEKQRVRAINHIAKAYTRLGDKESARHYAEMLPQVPHFCAPNVMRANNLWSDEEKLDNCKTYAESHLWLLCEYLFDIADPNYTNPCNTLTVAERVEILEQMKNLLRTVYGPALHAQYFTLYEYTRIIGALWLFSGEIERALDAFEAAYEYAVQFKTSYKPGDCYTSPAMRGMEAQPQSDWQQGADAALHNLYHRFTTQDRYKVIENHPRFVALLEKLKPTE